MDTKNKPLPRSFQRQSLISIVPHIHSIIQLPGLLLGTMGRHLSMWELSNYCQVSEKVNRVCSNEKFWESKLVRDYRELSQSKPDDMTNLQWYRELHSNQILKLSPQFILDWSTDKGYIGLAKWAIQRGVDLTTENSSLLKQAVKNCYSAMVKLFLSHGFNPQWHDSQ